MIDLMFVIGATGAAKSTFLKAAQEAMPERVGVVEVGKKMRAMFPPDYFKGQAAPAHTEQLAMELCDDGILDCIRNGKSVVLIDGQPRTVEQANILIGKYTGGIDTLKYNCRFIHLFAPTAVCKERLLKRDGADAGSLDLAMARLTGDLPALYEVLSILIDFDSNRVLTFDTSNPKYDPATALKSLLIFAHSPFEGTPAHAVSSSRS